MKKQFCFAFLLCSLSPVRAFCCAPVPLDGEPGPRFYVDNSKTKIRKCLCPLCSKILVCLECNKKSIEKNCEKKVVEKEKEVAKDNNKKEVKNKKSVDDPSN